MDETTKVEEYLKDMLEVMVNRSEKEVDAVMPGYTHLQVRCLLKITCAWLIASPFKSL
jgi:argininosuccinate lyase